MLFQYIMREIAHEKDLAGKRVLVTAGATQEPLDPVRFITNHSTGCLKDFFPAGELICEREAVTELILEILTQYLSFLADLRKTDSYDKSSF